MSESNPSAAVPVDDIVEHDGAVSCSDPTRRAMLLTALATCACLAAPEPSVAEDDQPGSNLRPQKADTLVFSEGVLHHTPSTEKAFNALVRLLRPGGEIMIYVYRRKAPVREYVDDYIRGRIAELPPDEAWALLRPLTRLGQALGELGKEVEVTEDVELLGIPSGT